MRSSGSLAPAEADAGRQHVEGGADLADNAGPDLAGPPEDGGLSHSAVPCAAFAAAEQACRAALLIEDQPGAVVGGEGHEGILGQSGLAKGVEHLPDAPVDFLDHVAVESAEAGVVELLGGEEGHVGQVVGEVDEEGLLLVGLDEADGLFRVAAGDGVLIGQGARLLPYRGEGGR